MRKRRSAWRCECEGLGEKSLRRESDGERKGKDRALAGCTTHLSAASAMLQRRSIWVNCVNRWY